MPAAAAAKSALATSALSPMACVAAVQVVPAGEASAPASPDPHSFLSESPLPPLPSPPQLIDPAVDALVCLLLRRLRGDGHRLPYGMRAVLKAMQGMHKPLLVVMCTDAAGETSRYLQGVRDAATLHGVPVVHALSRAGLGEALGAKHAVTCTALRAMPDDATNNLLGIILTRASTAYAAYISQLVECPLAQLLAQAMVAQQQQQ